MFIEATHPPRRRRNARTRRDRDGSYAILFGFFLVILLGFGALAIDVSYVRLAQMQTQDIADAASQAALYRLRRTGDLADARDAALSVVDNNRVVGAVPDLDDVTFGVWDHTASPPSFTATEERPNAVKVRVSRRGDNAVGLFLARLFGFDAANITREATSSTRALHVVLAMDITGSWSQKNFRNAQLASIAFLDVLESSYSEYDMVGMTIFSGRYAWEYTPLRYVEDEDADGVARTNWGKLNVASKGGTGKAYPNECALKTGGSGKSANANVFTAPVGGCYPAMPREYTDEPGTDHTTSLIQARTMFESEVDPTAFQRSALASSVALGCRAAALVDPGEGDTDWDTLATAAEDEVLLALASTGAPCEPDECTVELSSFGTDPGRSLGCTVSREFQPLTSLVLDPMAIAATIVVRMEWQR